MRHEYKILVGIPERQISLAKPRNRRKDNTKINLKGVGCEGADRIGSGGQFL
jgi:hypothetical protein